MKINNLNLTLQWETTRDIPESMIVDEKFPSYNIKIKDKYDNLIKEFFELCNHEKILDTEFVQIPKAPKVKYFINFSKTKVKSDFKYSFKDNYKDYKESNNKIGFYKEFHFFVDFNNNEKSNFNVAAEYAEVEDLDKNILFNKIYRSSDYLAIKFLIDKEYFNLKNIYSILVLAEASNKIIKNKKLLNLFTENIKEKWLDVNNQTVLLTIPFIESDIAEISENINIKVIPLNFVQSEIYKFLEQEESQEDINKLYQEYFPNQCFNIGKIYKQSINNETVAFYQNYLYLFNNQSLYSNSLTSNILINDMTFNSYFPLLKKDQSDKTLCLSNDLNTDDILDNTYNIQKEYLGFYDKNATLYEDVAIDLDYLQNQGILQAKIIEIEENNNACNIYIEFITTFFNNEKFYIETSNNLKYTEKYKTTIDNKDYATLLFKYSYDLQSLNEYLYENPSINKSQIISDKDLISFSAKLML